MYYLKKKKFISNGKIITSLFINALGRGDIWKSKPRGKNFLLQQIVVHVIRHSVDVLSQTNLDIMRLENPFKTVSCRAETKNYIHSCSHLSLPYQV